MKGSFTRRVFVGSMPLLPFATHAALQAQVQPEKPAFPLIDTHIHIFDKTRPDGAAGYPRTPPGGGEPPQGVIALPNRYKSIAEQFGVVGAIIVESSARVEDNYWLLDVIPGRCDGARHARP